MVERTTSKVRPARRPLLEKPLNCSSIGIENKRAGEGERRHDRLGSKLSAARSLSLLRGRSENISLRAKTYSPGAVSIYIPMRRIGWLCTCCARSRARFNKRIIYLSVYEARAIIDDKYWQMLDRATRTTAPLPPVVPPPPVIESRCPCCHPLLPVPGPVGARSERARTPKIEETIFRWFLSRHCRGPPATTVARPSRASRNA